MKHSLPLEGIRVVDLTHYWAGPHATRILADFGAEVIKVEYVGRLCVLRGAFVADGRYDKHPRWFQVNRNKLGITLDLRDPRDREIFVDLVRIADVVAENSRGGVLARHGFAYDTLKGIKPDVILLSMPAYGGIGPWAGYAGVGGSLEAVSGVQWLTAYGPDEKRMRIREVDAVNGVMGACACMTALVHRQRTGEGQWIDLSQLEATIHSLIGSQLLEVSTNQASRAPAGNRHPHFAPQGCYRCRGDDAWVTITIRSDGEWQRLCDRVGLGDWKVDPRFATTAGRMERHDEIDAAIERWTASHPALEVMRVLQSEGIAAGAVHSVADLAKDPHLAARDFFQGAVDGTPGRFPGSPVRLSSVQPAVRRRGPRLGEHGHDVICDMLGRPENDVTPVKVANIRTGYDIE